MNTEAAAILDQTVPAPALNTTEVPVGEGATVGHTSLEDWAM